MKAERLCEQHWKKRIQIEKMNRRMHAEAMLNRSLSQRARIAAGKYMGEMEKRLQILSVSYNINLALELLIIGGGFFA